MSPVMPHLGKRVAHVAKFPNGKIPGCFDAGLVVAQSTARITLVNENLSPVPLEDARWKP